MLEAEVARVKAHLDKVIGESLQKASDDEEVATATRAHIETEVTDYLRDVAEQGIIRHPSKARYAHRVRVVDAWVTKNNYVWVAREFEFPDGTAEKDSDCSQVNHPRTYKPLKQGPHAPRRLLKKAARSLVSGWKDVFDVSFIPVEPIKYFSMTIKARQDEYRQIDAESN